MKISRLFTAITQAASHFIWLILVGIAIFPLLSSKVTPTVSAGKIDGGLLYKDDDAVIQSLKANGSEATLQALAKASREQNFYCHNRAHFIGKRAYDIEGNKVFEKQLLECQSGVIHGAMEQYFTTTGTTDLKKTLNTLCSTIASGFSQFNCYHGMGHGLIAWEYYDLPQAITDCNLLESEYNRSACRAGVFMENFVGTRPGTALTKGDKPHVTKYINTDPQFPCSLYQEPISTDCYIFQTDVMWELAPNDWNKIAQWCDATQNTARVACFRSMGRTTSAHFASDVQGIANTCSLISAQIDYQYCMSGSAEDKFWDFSGKDLGLSTCSLVRDTISSAYCYGVLIERAHAILSDDQLSVFCGQLPLGYAPACLRGKTSS